MKKVPQKLANPVARTLRKRRFKQKIVSDKKIYNRKKMPSPQKLVEGILNVQSEPFY